MRDKLRSFVRVLFTPSRRRVRGTALVLMAICFALAFMALTSPGKWRLGPIQISLRNTKNPGTVLALCFVVWHYTSVRNFGRVVAVWEGFVAAWQNCTRRRQLVLAVLSGNAILGLLFVVQYPHHIMTIWRWDAFGRANRAFDDEGVWRSYLPYFAMKCAREIPPDARILFHGHIDGMDFSYEVYPRRVFMLPGELFDIAKSWHRQPWLEGAPEDPMESYWHRNFPSQTIDEATFIREHGITHQVYFDRDDPMACRWEAVR